MKLLKVSSQSKPNLVAGAIAGIIRDENKVQVQTIGAGALNQAVCIPFFKDIEINGEVRTAIVITVEVR